MRKAIALGLVLGFALAAAPAPAHDWQIVHPVVAQPACPAGIPVQTITVINQANVRPDRLALVERAAVDQSLQVRRWWGTPCVQFGPGGWKLYLKQGAFDSTSGEHFAHWPDLTPYINVRTGAINYEMWSWVFTHEIVETLANPTTANSYYFLNNAGSRMEIADPVELRTYRLDGVNVTDFVTPNWYAGATTGKGIVCRGDTCVDNGPLIAQVSNAGPWDQAGVLHHAWEIMDGTGSSA